MKVLLLSPNLDRQVYPGDQRDKLGLLYLAAVLDEQKIPVKFLDRHVEHIDNRNLRKHLLAYRPTVIGISIVTEAIFDAITCARLAKETLGEVNIVAGGPHPSLAAEDLLDHVPEVDYVVRGEGEHTFLELLEAFVRRRDISQVKGLTYRSSSGKVVHNTPQFLISNLDEIPFPARHYASKYRTKNRRLYYYWDRYPGQKSVKMSTCLIISSRGCPFQCSFCASSVLWRRRWRARSPDNVLAELEKLKMDYGVDMVEISDDAFTMDKARAERICNLIIKKKLGLRWNTHIRVDAVNYDLLKLMKEAGCYYVSYGVESGSQRILDEIVDKRLTLEQILKVTRWLDQLGFLRHANFMISHPSETKKDAQDTLALMDRLGGKNNLAITVIYPGTKIERIAREKGLLPKDFTWTKPLSTRYTLPSIRQRLPYFVDTLSWEDVCQFLFGWASRQEYSLWEHTLRALKNIRSLSDIRKILFILMIYLKKLLKQTVHKIKGRNVRRTSY